MMVAKHKQDTQRIEEAIADYDKAFVYMNQLANERNSKFDNLGVVISSDDMEEKENYVSEVDELYSLSLIRVYGIAECWVARGAVADLQRAKVVFEAFLQKNQTILSWVGCDTNSVKLLLIKTLNGLGSYQDAYDLMLQLPANNQFSFQMLRADLLVKLDNLEEALQIYNNLSDEVNRDMSDSDSEKDEEPANAKIIDSKIKSVQALLNKKNQTLEFDIPIGNCSQRCNCKANEASHNKFLTKIQNALNKNEDIRNLKLTITSPSGAEHKKFKSQKGLKSGKETPPPKPAFDVHKIAFVNNIIEMLKTNKKLCTLSIDGFHLSKTAAAEVSHNLLEAYKESKAPFIQSLFALDLRFKGEYHNEIHTPPAFWRNRLQMMPLFRRNFGRQLQSLRIYQAFVLMTFAMQVKPNQNWDPLVSLMLPFLADPAEPVIKKYLREPAAKMSNGWVRNGDYAFCPERKIDPVKVSKKKKHEEMKLDPSPAADLPVMQDEKKSKERKDTYRKFNTTTWRQAFFDEKQGNWKANMAFKSLDLYRKTLSKEKKNLAAEVKLLPGSQSQSQSSSNSNGKEEKMSFALPKQENSGHAKKRARAMFDSADNASQPSSSNSAPTAGLSSDSSSSSGKYRPHGFAQSGNGEATQMSMDIPRQLPDFSEDTFSDSEDFEKLSSSKQQFNFS